MAWLDWLTGGVEECPDCIWLSSDAKWRGVAKTVQLRMSAGDGPTALLAVAHFPRTLHELQTAAPTAQLEQARVKCTTVELLLEAAETAMGLRPTDRLEIIAVERHFLPEPDARLLKFANDVPCHCRLTYHLSLEDPLLQQFSDQWVKRVLEQLGMTEDEAVQSRMFARRIRAAQQKFARQVSVTHSADSAEEWLSRNARETLP